MTLLLGGVAAATTVSMFVAIAAGIRAVNRLTRELERTKSQLGYERILREAFLAPPEWVSQTSGGGDCLD